VAKSDVKRLAKEILKLSKKINQPELDKLTEEARKAQTRSRTSGTRERTGRSR